MITSKRPSSIISYPEHMVDVGGVSIRIMQVLQSTLELEKLIALFHTELNNIVRHDHISYVNSDENITIAIGKPAKHNTNYRLALFGHDLGELFISRRTKLLDNEIVKMENLLSALIYPLHNAILYNQVAEKAYVDPLTGANNRAAFDKAIKQEFELASRHESALSLMMIDVDNFKHINDNYGHLTGDAVLKSFVERITECMRNSDTVFRYGGEEFTILLRNTGLKGAALLAKRMCKKVGETKFECKSVNMFITMSIGVAQQKNNDADCKSLIERADKNLYRAKKLGRNQIIAG